MLPWSFIQTKRLFFSPWHQSLSTQTSSTNFSIISSPLYIYFTAHMRSGDFGWPQTRWVEASSFSGNFSGCKSLSFHSPCLPLILQRLLSDFAFLITFPIGEGTMLSLLTEFVLALCINDCYDPQEPTPAWTGPLSSVSESRVGGPVPFKFEGFP